MRPEKVDRVVRKREAMKSESSNKEAGAQDESQHEVGNHENGAATKEDLEGKKKTVTTKNTGQAILFLHLNITL